MLRLISIVSLFFLLAGASAGQGAFKPRDANEETAWNIYTQYKQSKANEARLRGAIEARKKDNKIVSGSIVGGLAIPAEDRAELLNWQKELNAELALQQKLLPLWNKKFRGRYGELADISQTITDPATGRTMDRIEFRLRNFPFDPNGKRPLDTVTEPSTAVVSTGSWELKTTNLWSDNPGIEQAIQEYASGGSKVKGTISAGSSVHSWINSGSPDSPRTSLAILWNNPPPNLKPGEEVLIRADAIDKGSEAAAPDGGFVMFNVSIWATNDEKSWIQIPGGGRDHYAFPRKQESKEYRFTLPATNYRLLIVKVHTGNMFWTRYFQYIYDWNGSVGAKVTPVENPRNDAEESSTPITVKGGVLNNRALSLPPPVYPSAARSIRAAGPVSVKVTVGANGKVVDASATSGHPLLRTAAEAAAREAAFAPPQQKGKPVQLSGVLNYYIKPGE